VYAQRSQIDLAWFTLFIFSFMAGRQEIRMPIRINWFIPWVCSVRFLLIFFFMLKMDNPLEIRPFFLKGVAGLIFWESSGVTFSFGVLLESSSVVILLS